MSRLLDNNNVNFIPRVAGVKTSFLGLGADLEKYAILEERGEASNLHKLDLSNSIYLKD